MGTCPTREILGAQIAHYVKMARPPQLHPSRGCRSRLSGSGSHCAESISDPSRPLYFGYMQHPDAFGRYKPVAGRGNHLRTIHDRTIDKYDHIGVLLDSSRFPEVGQQRCFIGALLNLARQLRQQDNRNIEFLGQQFGRTAGGSYLRSRVLFGLRVEVSRSCR